MPGAERCAPEPKANGAPGKSSPAIFALYLSEDRCSRTSPKQSLLSKTKTPRTGNLWPGLTGGLAPSASEPAPSHRSSDLPRERDSPGTSNPL